MRNEQNLYLCCWSGLSTPHRTQSCGHFLPLITAGTWEEKWIVYTPCTKSLAALDTMTPVLFLRSSKKAERRHVDSAVFGW